MEKIKKKKVIVAMSGGIDSSVAAALLKKAGYEVVGVFMRFWREPGIQRWNRCCSPDAERRAKRIAALLGISLFVLNFEKEFKKKVVDRFLKEHKIGLTPNPCVVCNKEIKFGLLLEEALKLKADYIATGHYAINKKIENRNKKIEYKLLRAKDKEKDQSYFLWQLNQNQLSRILFPVGGFTKKEVRGLAWKFKLPVFDFPESQEICFIQTTVNDFLSRHLKQKPRQITDTKEKIIGQHRGLAFYTIGQRKGIGLPGGPYFVLEKDIERNLLVVTKNEKDLYKKELVAEKVNWISGKEPRLCQACLPARQGFGGQARLSLRIKVKIRYRQEATSANIYKIQNAHCSHAAKYKILFGKPQRAITPGQSVVFYLPVRQAGRGKELLGGGIIK